MEKLRARDFRHKAAESCKPYSGMLALTTLVYLLIVAALSYTGLGLLILGGPLTIGYVTLIKNTIYGTDPKLENIFDGFGKFGDAFITYLLYEIFLCLWTLLFIIPGIIKTYSYALTFYLVKDEGLSGTEAITKSRQMMHGHKWRLFCLEFSYIGWILLCILTFGILFLWVNPKMEAAKYHFYLDLKGEDSKKVEVVEEAPAADQE